MPAIEGGRVCVFGAGGPVGAMAARSLQDGYVLRLTDLLDIHDILRDGPKQGAHAPLPSVPEPPHEWRTVDVADYDQVLDAARGMDALINATVIRNVLEGAFRVNLIGAYHIVKAAAECGISRVIHTGPRFTQFGYEGDYGPDFDIPTDVPFHAGTNLYALTKYLGNEAVRVFAEQHGVEVLCFLYCHFRPGDGGNVADGTGIASFSTSWEDTGEAFLYGLRAPALPRPFEVFDICGRLPHGKYGPQKAERLLGWTPKHNFERLYRRPEPKP